MLAREGENIAQFMYHTMKKPVLCQRLFPNAEFEFDLTEAYTGFEGQESFLQQLLQIRNCDE